MLELIVGIKKMGIKRDYHSRSDVSTEKIYGGQIGIWNDTDTVNGLQAGGINTCNNCYGVQVGIINYSEELTCGQFGAINRTRFAGGFQVGLINSCDDDLDGFQAGLFCCAGS